jgi:uncharacterized membrane protein YphA (DoxX/SURF4 family)
MFSTFPDGWPGAGLLLIRATTGTGLVVQGVVCLEKREPGLPFLSFAVFTIAVGGLLLIGCLTRFAGVAAALVSLAAAFSWLSEHWLSAPWFPGPSFSGLWPPGLNVGLFATPMTAVLIAVMAVAVVCLGAGAFSVDARLFGRREVIIPKNLHDPDF